MTGTARTRQRTWDRLQLGHVLGKNCRKQPPRAAHHRTWADNRKRPSDQVRGRFWWWPGTGSHRRPSDFQRDDLCHPTPCLTCTDVADCWR